MSSKGRAGRGGDPGPATPRREGVAARAARLRSADLRRRSHRTLEAVEHSTDDDPTVPELVRRAKQHDEFAFAELYIRFFDPVQRYLSIALKNHDDAQEMAQEVFMRALRALDGYDPDRGAFRDWLFSLVRHIAIDHLRRGSRAQIIDLADAPTSALPVADRAASLLERLDPDADVRSMLGELPYAQRRVLTLRFLFGFTTAEIADVIGATQAGVRQIQHRALKALASITVTPRETMA